MQIPPWPFLTLSFEIFENTHSTAMILFLKSLAIFILNKKVWSFLITKQWLFFSRSTHLDFGIFYEAFKGLQPFFGYIHLPLFPLCMLHIFQQSFMHTCNQLHFKNHLCYHDFGIFLFIKCITQTIKAIINAKSWCTTNEHHERGIFCVSLDATSISKEYSW